MRRRQVIRPRIVNLPERGMKNPMYLVWRKRTMANRKSIKKRYFSSLKQATDVIYSENDSAASTITTYSESSEVEKLSSSITKKNSSLGSSLIKSPLSLLKNISSDVRLNLSPISKN